MLTHEQESLSGQQIGNYEIVEPIAARKVSDLYLARDVKLDRLVYLEVLRTTADEDADLAGRFQRRMETASQIKHDGIALVSDIDVTEENLPYAALEYFPVTTLAERLADLRGQDALLPVIAALRLVQQIAQALSAAHSAGLVHHDLCPENIMLREDGTPVLLDLGVPITVTADSVLNNKANGDMLHYTSPEEMEGKTIGRRSNIYSLGVILYELLAGHRPKLPNLPYDIFPQANMPKEEPLEEAREGLAGETYRLVRNCLWRQEWSRFETADEMITAIETAVLAEQELPNTPAWSGGRRRSLYALLPLAIIALLVLGFLAVRNSLGGNGGPEATEPAATPLQSLTGDGTPTETPDEGTAAATSTSSPFGDSIQMGAPAVNQQFTRNAQINFNWFWLNVLNPGEQFTVYILDGEEEIALEPSLTEPNADATYRLTVNAADIPARSSELAWQVRLEEVVGGEVELLVASNTVPFVIIASTATATRTPSVTPTGTVLPTGTATPTPTTDPAACVISRPPGWEIYFIQPGDSVASLAFSRGVTPESVMEVNCLTVDELDELSINQQIYLPPLPATPTLSPVPPTQPPSGGGGVTPDPPPPTETSGPAPSPTEPPRPTDNPTEQPTFTPPPVPTELLTPPP